MYIYVYYFTGLHGFIDDPNSKMVHPKPDGVFAVRALGAVVWYLSQGNFHSTIGNFFNACQ